MSRMTEKNPSTHILLVCAIVGVILFCGQLVAWATTACQVPNPNTVYCTEIESTESCFFADEESECYRDSFERNQFPDGGASASSGTTKEEEADCWQEETCTWDADNTNCIANGLGDWQKGDKTVVGDNPCPTDES